MYERLRAGADSRLRCRSPPPRHPLFESYEDVRWSGWSLRQATPYTARFDQSRDALTAQAWPVVVRRPDRSARTVLSICYERLAEGRTERRRRRLTPNANPFSPMNYADPTRFISCSWIPWGSAIPPQPLRTPKFSSWWKIRRSRFVT